MLPLVFNWQNKTNFSNKVVIRNYNSKWQGLLAAIAQITQNPGGSQEFGTECLWQLWWSVAF